MTSITRTNSANPHFADLVKLLDADLAKRDGDDHAFYAQFNKTVHLQYVVVLYKDEVAVSCGAIREIDPTTIEVKRMYTLPECRGEGMAGKVLEELEKWAAELGYQQTILETGIRQPEAIALYEKSGYLRIDNYGQYADVYNSVCFGKRLRKKVEVNKKNQHQDD